jgi:hypothetical protein
MPGHHPLNTSNQDMISAIQKMGYLWDLKPITQSSLSSQDTFCNNMLSNIIIACEDDAIRSLTGKSWSKPYLCVVKNYSDCGHMIPSTAQGVGKNYC